MTTGKATEFILRVSSPNEYLDGFDYFVVEIEPETARRLLSRVRLLEEIRKKDKEAYELSFWDFSGCYFGGDPDEHRDGLEPSPTECNRLIVQNREVRWICYPKHTDVPVTTDSIRVDQLAAIAEARG